MKKLLLHGVVMLALLAVCVSPASAQAAIASGSAFSAKLASPFYTLGPVTFAFPNMDTSTTVIDFRQFTYSHTELENIEIDFPPFADGAHIGPATAKAGTGLGIGTGTGIGTDGTGIGAGNGLGPGIGAGLTASANVLPFGLVNLALPDIRQTVYETLNAGKTSYHRE